MLRIAALVAGALAGILASLILALGGLEVSASAFGGLGERQVALARFALFVIANLSLLGAGVTLAVPRAGAALLALAAMAWAAAALVLGHSTDLVLIGPPALGLVATALAVAADIFGRRAAARTVEVEPLNAAFEADPYDVAPAPSAYREQVALMTPPTRDPLDGLSERDYIPGRLNSMGERNARATKKEPEPPAFRTLEEEDEPTFLARFGRAATGLLSFGLYAAAAGAVLLVVYNVYQRDDAAALVAAPSAAAAEKTTSIAQADLAPVPAPSSSEPPRPSSSEPPAPAPKPLPVITSTPLPGAISSASSASSEPPADLRIVGEPAPDNAVTADPSTPVELEPSSEPPIAGVVTQEPTVADPTLPAPDTIDPAKVPPVPAIMSPELAEARRNGGVLPGFSDI